MPKVHPLFLLHSIFLLLIPLAISVFEPSPDCPTHCGNVEIPFPFGIGPNCPLNEDFEILCNASTNPPTPYGYISHDNSQYAQHEVVEIILSRSQIRVKPPPLYIFSTCYNGTEGIESQQMSFLYQYSFSDENWVTTIGCDDLSTMKGYAKGWWDLSCVSFCSNNDTFWGDCPPENGEGYSTGDGCCRNRIPKGTTYLRPKFADLHESYYRPGKLYPCAHQFIGEKLAGNQSAFSYSVEYLNNDSTSFLSSGLLNSRTWLLDWRIIFYSDIKMNCSEAAQHSTFACRDTHNSVCVDVEQFSVPKYYRFGYQCRCRQGYTGNPYITQGCTDVDECKSTSNPCLSICTNTPGSFTCSCPRWHHGDGMQDGTGCRNVLRSIMINLGIGLGSGMGLLLLLLMCFCLYKVLQKRRIRRNRKVKFFKRNGGLLLQQQTDEGTQGKTNLFSSRELEKATDNFNESRFLGQGGQGTVYKGMLSDGKIVAIKKSKLVDENQLEQFINEVAILSEINHRNVVKLLGCCLETEVPLLVYEYVPNGTLFELIHDINPDFPFTWNMRLKMAADVAGAVAYLHSASSIPIYHRDIKSSNILLDEKYVVKVSDFGTSRLVAVDQTHLTTLVKGTFGYLDPEYFQSSQFTEKSDVYSFGVVLVELLTGERPISFTRTGEERSLVTWFLISMETNNMDTILDAQVSEHGQKDEVMGVARLAKKCLNWMGKMRPTMKEVAMELESLRMSQMHSTVIDENQERKFHKARPMMIPDTEYTWTTNDTSVTSASSPSDLYPIMSQTF